MNNLQNLLNSLRQTRGFQPFTFVFSHQNRTRSAFSLSPETITLLATFCWKIGVYEAFDNSIERFSRSRSTDNSKRENWQKTRGHFLFLLLDNGGLFFFFFFFPIQ